MIKNIFARIWAVWSAIWFTTTILLFFIPFCLCYLWKEPKRSYISYPLYRLWIKIYHPFVGIFIKVKGVENFKPGKNYIVVCNHNTLIEITVSSTRIPGPNKTIAKIEMSRIPVFGTVYKLGSILVDRKDKNSRANSYIQMKAVLLDMGLHMCLYPEGTRNKTGKPLKEFHSGAFKLAVDTKKEIIPALLFGTTKVMPNDKPFYFLPGKIEMHFLSPVKPGNDTEELKEEVFNLMWNYYEKNS